MHEAYQISQLIRPPVQIESLTAYGDYLFVGTRQGHLVKYRVVRNDDKYDIEMIRYDKSFSKKPIQQLEAVPEHNLLVSLSDNVVQVNDLNSVGLSLIHQAAKTRGATIFTIATKKTTSLTDAVQVLIRLCVAVKRKLQLYYWKNNEFFELSEINLSEAPKAISWCQETICVGFRGEYSLFQVGDGKQTKLFPTSSSRSSEPCIVKVSDCTFALGRETQTILVTIDGGAERPKALRWSDIPTALAWDEPYVLGIVGDSIEVQTLEPNEAVQTIQELNKVRLITYSSQGFLYAASVSQIWCLSAVDVAKQRKVLLENKQFQLALTLTSLSNETEDDKSQMIHQIQTLLAYDLFNNKKFHESMKEFLKLGVDAYDVIRLFPDLLPQQTETTEPAENLDDKDLEAGLLALIDYLTEVRFNLQKDMSVNVNASGNLNERSVPNKSTQSLLQIIDTTLLKCYLQTNDALVAPLLRLNHCHLAETERTLKKHGKHAELIILYNTKGQHRRALELLQSENATERTVHYLQQLGAEHMGLILEFADWVLKAAPEEGLKIFTEDVAEVEALPRPRVLDFLLRSHSSSVIPYLEHVVHAWEDTNPLFHNALVHQYRTKILTNEPGAQLTRTKLLEFLEKSTNYTPETVLGHFPTDDLLEERAIIVGRMGKHDLALFIYVRALGDYDKAIAYCTKVVEQNGPGGQDVFVTLIKLVLNPQSVDFNLQGVVLSPKTAECDVEKALELLKGHAEQINPLSALAVLPDNVSVCRIYEFLQVALHKALRERRNVQLLKGLLFAQHLQCQELRLRLQSQSILVTDLNVCPVCKKRFGNQSALVRYPNGEVVHYSCQEKKL